MPYMSPDDRQRYGGGMGSMSSAGPGQLEGGKPGYDENAPPDEAEHGETFNAPLSALGGKKLEAGQTVSMKVINVDEKNGMVELAMSTGEDNDENHPGMGEMDEHPALRAMDAAMPK